MIDISKKFNEKTQFSTSVQSNALGVAQSLPLGIRLATLSRESQSFEYYGLEYAERVYEQNDDYLQYINKTYPPSSNPSYIEIKYQHLAGGSQAILFFMSGQYGNSITLFTDRCRFEDERGGTKQIDTAHYWDDHMPHIVTFSLGTPTVMHIDDIQFTGVGWYSKNVILTRAHLCPGYWNVSNNRFFYIIVKDTDGNTLGEYRPFWSSKEKKVVILDLCDLYDETGNIKQYNYSNPDLILPGPRNGINI